MARRFALVMAVVLGAAALVLALAGETASVGGREVSCAGPLVRAQTGPDAGPFTTAFQRDASAACVSADRQAFLGAAGLVALAVAIGMAGVRSEREDSRRLVPAILP